MLSRMLGELREQKRRQHRRVRKKLRRLPPSPLIYRKNGLKNLPLAGNKQTIGLGDKVTRASMTREGVLASDTIRLNSGEDRLYLTVVKVVGVAEGLTGE